MRKYGVVLFTLGMMLSMFATADAADLKVAVPFDFVVSGKTLPAATYRVRESQPNNRSVVTFEGQNTTFALATDVDTTVTGAKLVFHRVGNQYFLSDIVGLDGNAHFAVSRAEAKLARQMNEQHVDVSLGN